MQAQKSLYSYRIEPQEVDFTLRATIPALGSAVLNTAGTDAHGKGFGVDALNADNHSWVLSRIAFEFDSRPAQYADYTVATWISDYGRVLSTRNFVLSDAEGHEFGRAVSQWAMIDLASRAAVDLSWVGDAHADAIVDVPPPAAMPRKIRAVEPSVVRAQGRLQRHRLQPPCQYHALHRDDARHAARRKAHFRSSRAARRPFPQGVPSRADFDRRGRVPRRGALFEIGSGEGAVAVRAAVEWK